MYVIIIQIVIIEFFKDTEDKSNIEIIDEIPMEEIDEFLNLL